MTENEIIPPSTMRNMLTLDEHIARIEAARAQVAASLYDFCQTLCDARDELGDSVFQGELSARLGMSRPYLNRMLAIGDSAFIRERRQDLPEVFTSLYELSLIEKGYERLYGEQHYQQHLHRLIDDRTIDRNTTAKDIRLVKQDVESQLKSYSTFSAVKALKPANVPEEEVKAPRSFSRLVDDGHKFLNIVVDLTDFEDPGSKPDKFAELVPLDELVDATTKNTAHIFIRIQASRLDFGFRFLGSTMFQYADIFTNYDFLEPSVSGTLHLSKETVVLRGFYGDKPHKVMPRKRLLGTKLPQVMDFAENVAMKPNLLVFGNAGRPGWQVLAD